MSMEYTVKLTPHSVFQIKEIVLYISKVLLVPETAVAWIDYLEKQIAKLGSMPARFPLVDREPWHTNRIRRMPVKNYVIYYYIDESKKEVLITAVVYSKRNQLNALKEIP